MHGPFGRVMTFVVAGWVLVASAGCASSKKEVKAAAEANWKRMRSGMMLQMAQQQFDTGDLDQCEKTLKEALTVDGRNEKLFTLSGRVALERGELERAYHLLTQAGKLNEKAPEPHYYLGIVFQRWQQYDKAQQQYEQAYKLEADNVAYLLAVAEMHVAQDDTAGALKLLTEKLTYFDQNAGIRAGVAQIYMMQGQYGKAAEYFEKAAVLQPDNLRLVEDLATAQLAAGQAGKAMVNLRRLVESPGYSERDDLQRMLGKAYLALEQPDEAKKIYQKLTRKDANDAGAWMGMAQACWAKGDAAGSLAAAQRAIKAAPMEPEAYVWAGTVLQDKQQWAEALRMYEKAVTLAPKEATPVVLRGLAYERSGQLPRAIEDYRKALSLDPGNRRAKLLLDRALARATP